MLTKRFVTYARKVKLFKILIWITITQIMTHQF
uniref:Uncharacterized protein n=1 Tax=Anguilla anguilla TaxID=7936 RepID=A0A0E9QGI8_ANGAN